MIYFQCSWLIYTLCFFVQIGNVNNSMGHQIVGFLLLPFASVLASGSHPSGYRFQQKLLRHHLHMCLEQNTFQGFPITRLGRVNMKAIKYSYSIAIYCYCRMPETFAKTMNKCDRCSKWFHLDVCVDTNSLNKWFCENCI